jgi:hypothetical protein
MKGPVAGWNVANKGIRPIVTLWSGFNFAAWLWILNRLDDLNIMCDN